MLAGFNFVSEPALTDALVSIDPQRLKLNVRATLNAGALLPRISFQILIYTTMKTPSYDTVFRSPALEKNSIFYPQSGQAHQLE